MSYELLDLEELLRSSLSAMNSAQDATAIELLKELVARDPGHAYGHYLLAAQHAQLGLMDRAEAGFRTAMALAPADFAMPRFHLGQLLVLKGAAGEAQEAFAPLAQGDDALAAYACALSNLAIGDIPSSVQHLQEGLGRPQVIPALEQDMVRLLQQLVERQNNDETTNSGTHGASFLLSNYGRQD